MESIPLGGKAGQIFALYTDLIKNSGIADKLTVSTWLTVIETCRHSSDGLTGLLEFSKKKFLEVYDKERFLIDSSEENPLEASPGEQRRLNRTKRPKSVLLSKQRSE